jgi:hypothetical protein
VILHWTGDRLLAYRHQYERRDLAAWGRYAVAPRLERAAYARAVPEPGDGCKWCPAAATCPGLAASIDPGEPFDAVEGLRRLAVAKTACDALDARLRATADAQGGIRDGARVWGRTITTRREVDEARAREALQRLGPEVVASCEERRLTAKSIEDGLAMLPIGQEVEARDELHRAGAIVGKDIAVYRWQKAAK